MPMLIDTYHTERSKWDSLASKQITGVSKLPHGVSFNSYTQNQNTMTGITDFIGNLHGKHVLEYGCGLGIFSVLLATSGAKVTAFDLSPASIAVTRKRAMLNEVDDNIQLSVSAGENLPFADESFDIIFGKAILHHLDVKLGCRELYRVLKPGGKAVFAEPMGMNPLLNIAREHVPYPGKNPRGADRPLNYEEIRAWGKHFNQFRYQEIQLLSMLERGLGFRKRIQFLRSLDNVLLMHVPPLRQFCRYVVLFMIK